MNSLLTAEKLIFRIFVSVVLLIIVMAVCCFIGPQKISLENIFSGDINSLDYEILVHIRLPRVILACIVGAALACSGVVFQALLKNPLADPYILGISSGAGLGAIAAVLMGLNWTLWGRSPIAVFAFCGAMATVWLVWFIGRFTGKANVTGLLLAGVVVNAFFSAVIMFLTSIANSQQMHSTIFWLMGNMSEESFLVLWTGAGVTISSIVGLFYISPQLNIISFGQSDAQTIGINVNRIRIIAFSIAAAVTAISVSLSGLIGFVGLVVPHAIRLMFGPDHRQLIPLSAAAGAVFLIIADTVARIVVSPAQLPVGIVTAIVGGPFFLILLIKCTRTAGWINK